MGAGAAATGAGVGAGAAATGATGAGAAATGATGVTVTVLGVVLGAAVTVFGRLAFFLFTIWRIPKTKSTTPTMIRMIPMSMNTSSFFSTQNSVGADQIPFPRVVDFSHVRVDVPL